MSTAEVVSSSLRVELGMFSMLPREVRDKIYGFVMKFEPSSPRTPEDFSHLPLLLVSRRMHDEAERAFYRVNRFSLCIEEEPTFTDYFVIWKFQIFFGRYGAEKLGNASRIETMSLNTLQYVQNWSLEIGSDSPILVSGITDEPLRPNSVRLWDITEQACNILRQCHQIHSLYVEITCQDEDPDHVKDILDLIMGLRNIREAIIVANCFPGDWCLRPQYEHHMARVMALPEGVEAPDYVRVEDEFGRGDEEGIFLGSMFGSDSDPEDDDD